MNTDDTKPGVPADERTGDAPAGLPGSSAAPTVTRPQLLRSTDDRMVAGVCGGLGEHFGIDPVVFRIVIPVLSLFGGVGVLVYSLGWLLIPARDRDRPVLRRILAGKFDSGTWAATVVAVMGVALFFTYLDSGFGPSIPLLMITAVVLFMVWSDTKKKRETAQSAGGATMASAPAGLATEPESGSPLGPPSWWQVPGGGVQPPERKLPWPPRPKDPGPPRSYVALATMSAATIVGGLLWVIDRTATEVTYSVALAVLLGVVGLGLLAGTFLGRARILILPALVLTGLLAAITTLTVPLDGTSGQRTYTPTTVAEVPASYRLGMGDLGIDLRGLDLGPDGRVTVHAQVGAGRIRIRVPKDVTVLFSGRADVGDLRIPDASTDGFRPRRKDLLSPVTEPSRGTITLDTKVGLGQVEVLYGDLGRNPR
ncbi:PspC domain-containing protein [Streptomyces sp. SID3343]|uniref:PspC domain-containing protein n=1 Tax=Streptomyces sp. SID3343 TaxID=2690260 RepID=UPI00136B52A5|nr:PspC domain-containing protein [Streptomyces sp. SID3343]MYV97185.1 PspC domain-containing protein [Streptomyces sp. SID3343]